MRRDTCREREKRERDREAEPRGTQSSIVSVASFSYCGHALWLTIQIYVNKLDGSHVPVVDGAGDQGLVIETTVGGGNAENPVIG